MGVRTVAVIGASADRSKYSNKAVRAYVEEGWLVFPINLKGGIIERVEARKSLAEIPVPIDRVTLYLPPDVGMKVLPEIAAAKPAEFFLNPGAESDELVEQAKRLGLDPILACSILEIGATPAAFPD